jgi:hypothetical protein
MFERFTPEARNTIIGAHEQARRLGHAQILAEDVLLAAISDDQTSPGRILRECGVDPERLAAELTSLGQVDADALRQIGIDLDSVRRQIERAFGAGALDQPRGSCRIRPLLPVKPCTKSVVASGLAHHAIGWRRPRQGNGSTATPADRPWQPTSPYPERSAWSAQLRRSAGTRGSGRRGWDRASGS